VAEYRLYDVSVTLVTPLHIGTGRDLLHEYDYAIHKGHTWRINEDTLLQAQDLDDPGLLDQLARTPPAQLLKPEDFRRDAPFFRYIIRGTPRSKAKGVQVREQLKDTFDHPYLPGSSLKGALRTAIAWYAWRELGMRPERSRLGRSRRFAAQGYEKEIFGRTPQENLLRALHVGDSKAVGLDQLMLVNARVFHRSGQAASPIELEAVRPDALFRLTLKLDEALFTDWARDRGLHLRGADWLRQLPTTVQAHTKERLSQEVKWFTGVKEAQKVVAFYRQLQGARLPGEVFLLQLGWGTGWEDKTFGSHLQADRNFMEGILQSPRDGGYGLARGRRQAGDPFPKSRRVAMQVQRSRDGRIYEVPASPLGWALVEMQER
jgi:CRISPR-associated protein Csm5